jgi:hypothetical protein
VNINGIPPQNNQGQQTLKEKSVFSMKAFSL